MLRDADLVNAIPRLMVPLQQPVAQLYAWACERIYHDAAGQYDIVAWLLSAGRWRRWQRMIWQDVRGPRVLELGCGPGHLVHEGTLAGMDMIGLDLSPEMVSLAQRRYGAGGSYVRGDGRTLPFAAHTFDSVIATFPASYVLEDATLRECRRVLGPTRSGRLVILGLWVDVDLEGFERMAPVFFGDPGRDQIGRMVERVAKAGFAASIRTWHDGRATIGGVVGHAR